MDQLAKKAEGGNLQSSGESTVQLEQLTSANRQQTEQIQSLSQAAAHREALIGQLQAQLATARLSVQQHQQQLQAEREQNMQARRCHSVPRPNLSPLPSPCQNV